MIKQYTKKIKRKLGAVLIPPLLYLLLRFIWFTSRKKFHFITDIPHSQHVCVTWHGELLMTPQAYRHIHPTHPASAIISAHFDGSIMANTLGYLRISALRGSSRKGATQVLLQAFKSIKKGQEILITPDGPKGPRHSMSDGAIGIALKSKLPIFVMNFQSKSYWQLKSWDKFVIPKPFGKIDFYMQSISLDGMELSEAKAYLHSKMLEHTIK